MSFVHLHVHSQYSLLEASCQAKVLVKKAQADAMPALALTDYGNMFGAVEFYFAARDAGIKPILGLEVYIAPGSRHQRGEGGRDALATPNRRLVLLAQDLEGYRNLCRISTIGYKEGFYYRPRVDYEVLATYNQGLIALTGGLMGEVPWTLLNKGSDQALERIQQLKSIYPERLYLELNRTGLAQWQEINPFLLEVAKDQGLPVVAANDVHYVEPGDQLAQEVLICIGSNKTLQDESRFRLGSDQFYFKSAKQMQSLFQDIPEAIQASLEVAERCNLEFQLEDAQGRPIYHLPGFPTHQGRSLREEIAVMASEGLERRFVESEGRGEPVAEDKKPDYFQRLEYELSVIEGMGFSGYFLIVQDFIRWAKEQDIPVGPGRGSGAGSLVAYSLGITDLDPVPYNLIFERFLNPERISMPDFDIDFCQEKRHLVIDYVTQKYGEDSVSQIITYGRLQARAAIRDVGRVLGMTYPEVDAVAKLVPEKLGITLGEAIELEPRIKDLMDVDPKVATLMDLAQKIEGLVRHAGIHAAGVVIADGRIIDHAPLYRGTDGENVVQYDMKHAEKIGLIKFDFLGLKTLTHIKDALDLVAKNRGKRLTTQDIALSDPGIYEIMREGNTAGIFQFEGDGITDLLKKAKTSCFEDIVAINALYRPGPMDMIPSYLQRKHGEVKVEHLFPELEDILSETYGVVVYQEQVQLIASRIANYSLGEADMLRRAMGKKIPEVMAKQKDRFLAGAKENNHDLAKAGELFDTMAEFAKYGFNKSHAAAYCVVAAQTAWLKRYYPVEFYAALLSTEMSDTDKVVKYVKDAHRNGFEVMPPHINHSFFKFSVDGDKILFSLGAIKGVGEGAVEAIVQAREKLPAKSFESLDQFFSQVEMKKLNKKTIECLIKAGALDGFGVHRAQLMKGYVKYLERAGRVRQDMELGQVSLFSLSEESLEQEQVQLEDCEPWSKALSLANEKEVLGFYLSDHPLKGMEALLGRWVSGTVTSVRELEKKSKVQIVGLIGSMREIITKKGTRMAFCQAEDLTGSIELVVFPDAYAQFERALRLEGPLLLTGNLEKDEQGEKILLESAKPLDEVLAGVRRVVFYMDPKMTDRVPDLRTIMDRYPGKTEIIFELALPDLARSVELDIKLGAQEAPGLQLCSEFFEQAGDIFTNDKWVELQ